MQQYRIIQELTTNIQKHADAKSILIQLIQHEKQLSILVEDDGKGFGEIKNVVLNNPLDAEWIAAGKNIYELKCAACHKLTDQRVVGPGWKGITSKRTPEWIMNMTLNVDVMLAEDPTARELLKECLVRMPNQNLSMEDARSVLEFMYENDAK